MILRFKSSKRIHIKQIYKESTKLMSGLLKYSHIQKLNSIHSYFIALTLLQRFKMEFYTLLVQIKTTQFLKVHGGNIFIHPELRLNALTKVRSRTLRILNINRNYSSCTKFYQIVMDSRKAMVENLNTLQLNW